MVTISSTAVSTVDQFESVYAGAGGDASRIPWARDHASPALVNWLNAVAPSLVRCGARVAVVGCGLGADARELISRGYDVTAFDCSATAVQWARDLDPTNADAYVHADLFEPPARWRHRFDLVVEVNTLQSLSPDLREMAMSAIAGLMATRGHLLVVCRGAEVPVGPEDGPPWALTRDELEQAASMAGLAAVGEIASFHDEKQPPVLRIRALFRRG